MDLPNERTCSVLYATLELLCSILSAIYAASSFFYRVRHYKTGVNGVVHFAELINTYERSSFYLRVLKRLHSATIVALKRNVTFIMTCTVSMADRSLHLCLALTNKRYTFLYCV